MWSVESRIQDGLRLTSSAQRFLVIYLIFKSHAWNRLIFSKHLSISLDRVITATVDSVMIKIVLFFFSDSSSDILTRQS